MSHNAKLLPLFENVSTCTVETALIQLKSNTLFILSGNFDMTCLQEKKVYNKYEIVIHKKVESLDMHEYIFRHTSLSKCYEKEKRKL